MFSGEHWTSSASKAACTLSGTRSRCYYTKNAATSRPSRSCWVTAPRWLYSITRTRGRWMTCVACCSMNDFRSHGPQKSLQFFLTVGFGALHPRFRYPRAPMRSRTGILSLEISVGKSNSPGGFFLWEPHARERTPRLPVLKISAL